MNLQSQSKKNLCLELNPPSHAYETAASPLYHKASIITETIQNHHYYQTSINKLFQFLVTFFNFLGTLPKVVVQLPIQFTIKII